MTRQVLFNGTVLVRAGGATKVDASAFQSFGASGVGTVGVIGEADGGEPNAVVAFRTPKAMVEYFKSGPLADVADLLFRPMNDPRVPGGAVQVMAVKVNQSLQSSYDLLADVPDSSTPETQMTITSIDYGAHTLKISVEISTSGGGKIVELIFEDGIRKVTETSPVLGAAAMFTVDYTGAGSAATMTINSTGITTTVTGGPGGENLTIPFATYKTLKEIINYINGAADGAYTATAVTSNPFTFQGVDLDYVATVDIKTGPGGSFYAKLNAMIEWINANSSLVTAERDPAGEIAPDDIGPVFLASGVRGISSNTNWQDGIDLLGAVRVNEIVPLISQDLSNEGNGSTATFASVAAAIDSHAAFYSSTGGRSERQAYVGMKGNKTAILAQAGSFQSIHTVLTAQKITRGDHTGSLIEFDEWGLAAIMAGGRAGSKLGEPLVYKLIRASGLSQDSSWNPLDDGADMILGGVTFAFAPPNGGFKFDRVITTYTKDDNDAYTEESVVMGWKNVAYGLRTQLEAVFTGVRALPLTIQGVKDAASRILQAYRDEGQIVDSILEDGTVLKAYRDLDVHLSNDVQTLDATISPVEGINFQLNTLFLVPAIISA